MHIVDGKKPLIVLIASVIISCNTYSKGGSRLGSKFYRAYLLGNRLNKPVFKKHENANKTFYFVLIQDIIRDTYREDMQKKITLFSSQQQDCYSFLIEYSENKNLKERKKINQKFLEESAPEQRDFSNMNIIDLDLSNLKMPESNFNNTVFYNVDLCNANFESADLTDSKIEFSKIEQLNLTNANLIGAIIKMFKKNKLQEHTCILEDYLTYPKK